MNSMLVSMSELYPIIQDVLDSSGSATFTIAGISMQPMLYNRRDTVTIITTPSNLKKGDLIFYKADDGKFILHRIINSYKNGHYECRGDNCWTSEKDIRYEQIIGVVTEFTRNGKKHSVKEPLYRLYVFSWPFLHHFKKYYKYLPKFKK